MKRTILVTFVGLAAATAVLWAQGALRVTELRWTAISSGTTLARDLYGTGDPEGAVAAEPGSTYRRATGVVYVNTTGSGNTGWSALATGSSAGDASTNTSTSVDGEVALFSGTTGKLLQRAALTGLAKLTSGVLSAATAGTDYVSPASTETLTNKTLDAEGTGNLVTVPFTYTFVVAVCQNATASLGLSTPTANPAVAACVTGTNTQFGVAQFADGGSALSMQGHFSLPSDWTGAVDVTGKWRTSATTGDVVWQIATACVADAETADPSFNAASTVTDTAKGTTLQLNNFVLSSITTTGCAAGEELFFKALRDPANGSDTLAATAELLSLVFTVRRAL